jgi:hypothetical protein
MISRIMMIKEDKSASVYNPNNGRGRQEDGKVKTCLKINK